MTAKNPDIVVIGGGIIGCAITSYLAQKKLGKVKLIERNTLCSGITSMAANLLARIRSHTEVIPLVEETYRAINRIEHLFDDSLGMLTPGAMHISSSDKSIKQLKELISIADTFQFPHYEMPLSDLQQKIPWLNVNLVKHAEFFPEESFLDGYIIGMALIKEAKHHGNVSIAENTDVLEVLHDKNQITGVKTNRGTYPCSVVVNAAGIYANLLSVPLKTPLPMAPVRSVYYITAPSPQLYPQDHPITLIPDANVYTRPEASALLFGVRDSSPYFHPDNLPKDLTGKSFFQGDENWDILLHYTEHFSRLYRNFQDIKIAHSISAPCSYTPDAFPIIGKSQEIRNYYLASGCGGSGVSTSCGYGRIMAELINGERPFTSIDRFSYERLGEIDVFDSQFMKKCSQTRSHKKSG